MKIKSYSKQDLAMLYFPDNDPHTATNHLMRWITNCPPLVEHLRKTHYRRNSKYFIAHQVRVLFELFVFKRKIPCSQEIYPCSHPCAKIIKIH